MAAGVAFVLGVILLQLRADGIFVALIDRRSVRLARRLALSAVLPGMRRADYRPRRGIFLLGLLGQDSTGRSSTVQIVRSAVPRRRGR